MALGFCNFKTLSFLMMKKFVPKTYSTGGFRSRSKIILVYIDAFENHIIFGISLSLLLLCYLEQTWNLLQSCGTPTCPCPLHKKVWSESLKLSFSYLLIVLSWPGWISNSSEPMFLAKSIISVFRGLSVLTSTGWVFPIVNIVIAHVNVAVIENLQFFMVFFLPT